MARDLSATILAELPKGELPTTVELYDIFLDDQTLYYTDHIENVDFFDINSGAQTYTALSLSRSPSSRSTDKIDTMRVELTNVNSYMSSYVAANEFRGRRITIRKVFLDHLNSVSHQIWIIPIGIMDKPIMREDKMEIKVTPLFGTLNTVIPRRKQQLLCNQRFGDTRCTIDRDHADNKQSGTMDVDSTQLIIKDATRSEATNYWRFGELHITAGTAANIGEKRLVRKSSSGEIYLDFPLPSVPTTGDGYTVYRGCDKTLVSCADKFSNDANFSGFHSIPQLLVAR
ncbi:MAG: phage BR0599 family protein [Candidatus Orphnella occulta]|nr:phage BR0599 family protein [Candidatus Orphnella occulta]